MEQKSEKISMTSPVMESNVGSNDHVVQFTMPSKYTLKTLPIPNNDGVELKTIPRKTVAVLRYT
jgi:hypothetical protein